MDYQRLVSIEKECEKLSYLTDHLMQKFYGQNLTEEIVRSMNQQFALCIAKTISSISKGYSFKIRYEVEDNAIGLYCDDFDITLACEKRYDKIGDYFKVVLIMIHNDTWILKYGELRDKVARKEYELINLKKQALEMELNDLTLESTFLLKDKE